jgi:hypothetical protein
LGVKDEDFLAAIKSGRCPELSELVTEYLLSMDDFVAFRAMMERHNHELELEAMYEHARVVEGAKGAAEADGEEGADEMDDDERFLLEMAIQASLRPDDVRQQEAALEDAELMQALAMSMALEQERLVKEQVAAGEDEARLEAAKAEAEENQRQIHQAFLKQREDNAARAAADNETAPRPATPPTASPAAGQQQPPAHRSPAKPAITTRVLAPVGDRRGVAPAFGARGAPLPGIGAGAPVLGGTPTVQPSFEELKAKQASAPTATAPAATGPSEEEMQQRSAYLKAQREALVKAKKAERDAAVAKFQKDKGVAGDGGDAGKPDIAAKPAEAGNKAEAEMRRQIALRLKEDVLSEARKAAAA